MADTYTTIAQVAEIEFVERKSVFYGYAAPVKSEQEALAIIKERRTLMPDATHHVFGYHMKGGILARYSDDGEPLHHAPSESDLHRDHPSQEESDPRGRKEGDLHRNS